VIAVNRFEARSGEFRRSRERSVTPAGFAEDPHWVAIRDVVGELRERKETGAPPPRRRSRRKSPRDREVAAWNRNRASPGPGQQAMAADEETWHALDRDDVWQRLESDVERGLAEEEVRSRRAELGPNAVAPAKPRSGLGILFDQVNDVPIYLLMGSAGLSVMTGGGWRMRASLPGWWPSTPASALSRNDTRSAPSPRLPSRISRRFA